MTSNVLTAIENKALLIEYYLWNIQLLKEISRISVKSLELSFFESCQKKEKEKERKVQIVYMWIVEYGFGCFLKKRKTFKVVSHACIIVENTDEHDRRR